MCRKAGKTFERAAIAFLVAGVLVTAFCFGVCAEEKKAEPARDSDTSMQVIKKKLDTERVSFHFVEMPLPDAIDFLADLTEINFIVNVPKEKVKNITLKVNKMTLKNALRWLTKLAGVKHCVVPQGIYVGKKKIVRKVLRFYSIKGLVYAPRDFKGPEIKLSSSKDGDGGGFAFEDAEADDEDKAMDPQVIIDIIKTVTSHKTWEEK